MNPERLDVLWGPDLEKDLRTLFAKVRYTTADRDFSTPTAMEVHAQREKQFCEDFVRAVRFALERSLPPTVDSEVLEAMERLRLTVGRQPC